MDETAQIWLDVLQIVVPALMVVGGGAFTWWRFLRGEESDRITAEDEKEQERQDLKAKAEETVWKQVQHTIENQATRLNEQDAKMAKQDEKIDSLEERFNGCEEERILLKKQNELLREERDMLKGLVEELMQRLNGDES